MKKKLLGGLALALLLAGCGNSGDSDKEKTDDGKKTYKIGIIQQMEHPARRATLKYQLLLWGI